MTFSETARRVHEKWQLLSQEQKQEFYHLQHIDRARYDNEMEIYERRMRLYFDQWRQIHVFSTDNPSINNAGERMEIMEELGHFQTNGSQEEDA